MLARCGFLHQFLDVETLALYFAVLFLNSLQCVVFKKEECLECNDRCVKTLS